MGIIFSIDLFLFIYFIIRIAASDRSKCALSTKFESLHGFVHGVMAEVNVALNKVRTDSHVALNECDGTMDVTSHGKIISLFILLL